MPKFSTNKILLIIICMAALLRGFYFIELLDNPMPEYMARGEDFDQYNFVTLAKEILAKGWLGESFAGFSPTYGYFIAAIFSLFGPTIYAVIVVQMIFGLTVVYVFYKTAALLFKDEKTGLIAAVIACFYGPLLFYDGAILRACLITGINLSSFYFLLLAERKEKLRFYLIGGILVGLSIALRPNLLPVFVGLYLLLILQTVFKRRCQIIAMFCIGVMMAVMPISLRNQAIGQNVIIAKPGPTIFWLGNSYDTAGIGLTMTDTQQNLAEESGHDPVKTLKIFIREIGKYPQEYAGLYYRKFKMLFNEYEIPGNMNYYIFQDNFRSLQMAFLNFGLVCAFAIFSMIVLARRFREFGLLYTYIFGLSFFVVMFHVQSRYRMPVIPFYILFASFGLKYVYQLFADKHHRKLNMSLIVIVLLLLFTRFDDDIVNKYLHGRIGYISYSNWSFAYTQKYQKILDETGKPHLPSLAKALNFRNQSIEHSEGKEKDTLILNRVSIYISAHRYEDAYSDLTYLANKYPDSEYIKDTMGELRAFLENIPRELRHPPII